MAKVSKNINRDEVTIVMTDLEYKILRSFLWTANNTLRTEDAVLFELEENFKFFGLLRSDLDLDTEYADGMAEGLINTLV